MVMEDWSWLIRCLLATIFVSVKPRFVFVSDLWSSITLCWFARRTSIPKKVAKRKRDRQQKSLLQQRVPVCPFF